MLKELRNCKNKYMLETFSGTPFIYKAYSQVCLHSRDSGVVTQLGHFFRLKVRSKLPFTVWYNLLRKTVLHEVKVQITNPLNMNSHHPSTDGQAAIVPTSCSHNLTWRWEILKSKISSSWSYPAWIYCTARCWGQWSCRGRHGLACYCGGTFRQNRRIWLSFWWRQCDALIQ